MTIRLRYHERWAQCHPTSMNAAPITANCPASTPTLKVKSAVTNSERGIPSSLSAPAKPMPCSSPNANTSATRHDFSSDRKMFSTATYAIEHHSEADTAARVNRREAKLNEAITAALAWQLADAPERAAKRLSRKELAKMLDDDGAVKTMKLLGLWGEWQSGARGAAR